MADTPQWPTPPPTPPPLEQPRAPRRWLRRLGTVFLVIALVGLGGLSAYLWLVHDQWASQNAALREEASELGAQLADAKTIAIEAEAELETAVTQLANATSRISDLAAEEADAKDNLQLLENLIEAMISCADERQTHIVNISSNGLSYANSNARTVENQITEFCNGVEANYATYLEDKDS